MFSYCLTYCRQFALWTTPVLVAASVCAAIACGSLGPSRRTEEVRSERFVGVECEPGLVIECEPACSRGDADACEIAGLGYLEGKVVAKDVGRARIMLERACKKGRAVACSGFAKMAEDGQGVNMSEDRRATLLALGCDKGDGNACYRLGMHTIGRSSEPSKASFADAHAYFVRACDAHDPHGCLQLGIDAKTGRAGNKDVVLAVELLDDACNEDLAVACHELAELQNTPGTSAQNPARARQNFDKACVLGTGVACASLARLMESGEKNVARARELHERACELEQWPSCLAFGRYQLEASPSSAEAAFSRACKGQVVEACFEQAQLISGRTPGVETNTELALSLYVKSCEAELSPACSYAAQLELQKLPSNVLPKESRGRIVEWTKQGCERERQDGSCLVLAEWLAHGNNGLDEDPKRAASLLGPLCAKATQDADESSTLQPADYGSACHQLGRMHELGLGTQRNLLGASTLYDKACTAGHDAACLARAVLLWRGIDGVQRDPEAAVLTFKRTCNEKDSAVQTEACVHLGYAQFTGLGTPRDLNQAKASFERHCSRGSQLACAFLGHYLVTTTAGEAEKKRGETLLRSACDSANGQGCLFLADLPHVSQSQRRDLLARACQLDVNEACTFKQLASP